MHIYNYSLKYIYIENATCSLGMRHEDRYFRSIPKMKFELSVFYTCYVNFMNHRHSNMHNLSLYCEYYFLMDVD